MSTPPPDNLYLDTRPLRFMERLGWAVTAVYAAILVVIGLTWPEPYAYPWDLIGANLVMGRALNISWGLERGFSHAYLLFQCGGGDLVLLFLIYPWLVAGSRRAEKWGWVHDWLQSIRDTAERHRTGVARYGPIGLALFVVFPFWSTGPLVAGVVSHLLGMRLLPAFLSITIGNFLATAFWIAFFDRMREFSEFMGQWLPAIIVVVVLGLALYFRLTRRRKGASPSEKAAVPPPDSKPGRAEPREKEV